MILKTEWSLLKKRSSIFLSILFANKSSVFSIYVWNSLNKRTDQDKRLNSSKQFVAE